MSYPQKIFREYDIRGVVGTEITHRFAYELGRAYGTMAEAQGAQKIVIGYDGRLSSPDLVMGLQEGLKKSGRAVINVGLGPTPMVYFAQRALNADGAIMITGSHNPAHMNGFKMMLRGVSFFGDNIQKLYKTLTQGDFFENEGSIEEVAFEGAYVEYLLEDFKTHYETSRPLRVVWDVGNGAMGNALQRLLKKMPGEHIVLNGTIDGHFPAHHPDPTVPENLVELQQTVLSRKADLGIAFDGDGDRLGVVDETAQIIWGDQLLILFAEEVLKTHPGATILADVKASQVLFDKIKEMGGNPLMSRTGHSLIKTKMKELSSPLAGEMSGHVFFGDRNFGFDDALYAALRLCGIVGMKEKPLSAWRLSLPKTYATPELHIQAQDVDKFKVIQSIRVELEKNNIDFIDVDGVRVVKKNGWWLLRASNTQEILVGRVEALSEKVLGELKDDLESHLKNYNLKVS